MKTFKSHGKILLTGEYLVLHGATALGLPTQLGQSLTVRRYEECGDEAMMRSDVILWKAYKPDGLWFSVTLNPETLETIETDDQEKAERLSVILQAMRSLNPYSIQPGLCFETRLDFNPKWGLGSSSTLISNLAKWSGVDPFKLYKFTFGGSGYDVACANADEPIFYRYDSKQSTFVPPYSQQSYSPANFKPSFADHLFFVYQGQKQDSSVEVYLFNQLFDPAQHVKEIESVSQVSRSLPQVTSLDEFRKLLSYHESIIAHCIGKTPIQQSYPDFEGALKSLGAWGGDFLLAATDMPFEEVKAYFQEKGLTTIFKYQDLIL